MRWAALGMMLGFTLAIAALAQPAGTGVVSGIVVDASSGDAVRKAVVRLTRQGTPAAWAILRTDSSGRFRFDGLPAGKYALRATKAGVGTAIYGANSVRELGEFVELTDGQTRDGLKLRFIHTGSISGKVLDADGDPVVGVAITLMRAGRSLGERVLVNYRGGASTNDRGEYRIASVDPGQYYPVVSAAFRGPGPSSQFSANQFYGGARESKDANSVSIRGGESLTGIDFRLSVELPVEARGRIVGVPERPEPSPPVRDGSKPLPHRIRTTVTIMPAEAGSPGWQRGVGTTAPGYEFDFGQIPGGRYRIEAEDRGEGRLYAASQMVEVRQGMGEILLNLAPAIDLKGQIRVEGAGGPPPASLKVALGRGTPVRRTVSAPVGSDGGFMLAEIAEGAWGLAVTPLPRGSFLKSATLGDKDVRFKWLDIGPKTDAPLNIVISMNSGKVEGEVDAGGNDSARAGILLAPVGPLHNLTRFYYNTPADASGKFKFTSVAPGKYKIFALEKMAAMNFRSPEAADQLDLLGTEIEVTEGATVQAHPKLIPIDRAREALP